uniref:Uncharacterized protein n=1 Tax=Zea mays TaxID=4577 RepID=B6TTE3_MAIZE|nr:hypothetical protein [Zea mays]
MVGAQQVGEIMRVSKVKNRYRRMRRMEDALASS